MNEQKIRRLIKLVEESDVESLEIRPFLRTAIKITKSRVVNHNGAGTYEPSQLIQVPAPAPADIPAAAAPAVAEPPVETPTHHIEFPAPMVGTFYRAPSPESPPFVEVGQTVKPGDTLCIIEAMKLMNEIEAEQGGRIVEINIDNASPVEYGQILFTLDPTG